MRIEGLPGDAGDAVPYAITLINSSGVDAYDLAPSELFPTLPTGSAINAPSFTVTGTSSATAADFQWVADIDNMTFETEAPIHDGPDGIYPAPKPGLTVEV